MKNKSEEDRRAVHHLNRALHYLNEAKIQIDILQRDPVIDHLIGDELWSIKADIEDCITRDKNQRGIQPLIDHISEA